MSDQLAIAILGVIGSVIAASIAASVTVRVQRPAMRADAASKIEQASTHFAEMLKQDNMELRAQINELEVQMQKKIDALEDEIQDFRIGTTILISQLNEVNIPPRWTPKERR